MEEGRYIITFGAIYKEDIIVALINGKIVTQRLEEKDSSEYLAGHKCKINSISIDKYDKLAMGNIFVAKNKYYSFYFYSQELRDKFVNEVDAIVDNHEKQKREKGIWGWITI